MKKKKRKKKKKEEEEEEEKKKKKKKKEKKEKEEEKKEKKKKEKKKKEEEEESLDQLSASYSMSTGALSLGVKRPRREAYHLSPSSAEFKIQSSYAFTSHMPL